jgi:hypothetical protein
MERLLLQFLALGIIFVTLSAYGTPVGTPQSYNLSTKYQCQANGVVIHSKQALVSAGQGIDEVKFVAKPGRNQALTFGAGREYMIWPRAANGTFTKSLNVLAKDSAGTYKIMQEVDMGDSLKTKSNISLTTKDARGEDRPVYCKVEMEWVKK